MSLPINNSIPGPSHANNLDFLRLYFATSVLVTHSYALSGLPEWDIMAQFSHGQAVFSHTGVQGFLIISGYLITKSLVRSPDLRDYYFKRFLRVFPGLLVLLSITVGLGFFFSGKTAAAYFSHYSVREYFFLTLLLKVQFYLDGVFSANPYRNNVNGSLWTIPYEVFCYVVLSGCFFIRTRVHLLRWIFGAVFVGAVGLHLLAGPALASSYLPFWDLQGKALAEFGAFFLSGALWAVFPLPAVATRQQLATGAALLLLASLYAGGYRLVQFLALPLLVMAFGTLNTPWLSWARKYGDFSYGIYLWGFLVQQTLMHLFHFTLWNLMLVSIPVTYLCGIASWHLVEKRALRYKRQLTVPEPLL